MTALLEKKIRKLARVGGGVGLILTKEVKLLHWTDKDYVGVEVYEDGRILIKKVNY